MQVDLELALVSQAGIMAEVEGLVDAAFRAAGAVARGHSHGGGAGAPLGSPSSPPSSMDLPARSEVESAGGLRDTLLLSRHAHLAHASPPLIPWAPLALPLPRVSYTHALCCYGSDKPDRRFGLVIVEAASALADAALAGPPLSSWPHQSALLHAVMQARDLGTPPRTTPGTDDSDLSLFLPDRFTVRAFAVPGLGGPGVLSRKQLDALVADICAAAGTQPGGGDRWGGTGAEGAATPVPAPASSLRPVLHCVRIGPGGVCGAGHALATSLPPACQAALSLAVGAVEGDLVVVVAGSAPRAYTAAGTARLVAAEVLLRRKGLPLPPNPLAPGVPGLSPGDVVIAGGQLDPGYTALLPAKDSAGASAASRGKRSPGGARAGDAAGDSVAPLVSPSVDVFWVTDFPLFEVGEDGSLASVHHPFTAPRGLVAAPATSRGGGSGAADDEAASDASQLRAWLAAHPAVAEAPGTATAAAAALPLLALRAQHYDLVCNGVELGGGSVRLHDAALQEAVLRRVLAVPPLQMQGFSALLSSLALGAPPHGGFALGFDRFVALLAGQAAAPSIRDVIAFPKSAAGNEPMTGAPADVSDAALSELHVARTE